jgi:DNA ligase 1
MLSDFARVAAEVAATTKKLEKERIVADWIRTLGDASLERAVVFLAGSPFPRKDQRVTGVGWAAVIEAVSQAAGIEPAEVSAIASTEGDLGDAVARFFPDETPHDATIVELGEMFDRLAHSRGAATKANVLAELYSRVTAAEARYVTKILVGELRIGLQEGLVEAAIARAFEQPLADVRRAHMFTGDLGVTALLARSGSLNEAVMTLFRPIGFMLAQAEESAAGIFDQLGEGAIADDKYDGIRAQVHASGGRVRIWSRTLDDITERFPEVATAAAAMPSPVVLDGEIVAFIDRILPFATLQKRLGRRKVSQALLADAPVVFFAYDLLFAEGEVLFERPLSERLDRLRKLIRPDERIRLPDSLEVRSPADIEKAFDAARARANEGLVVKDPGSPYTPGRRGKAWLKYKKALATLDCVVTAARYGNGKRRNVLSDYTFAIEADGELLNIGKAYSGLTDVEIGELTELFKRITRERQGPVHLVQPRVVLEIAFDRIQESSRHKSGFALRFPRIARIRHDRKPEEISTLDEVRRIYEGQLERERGLE